MGLLSEKINTWVDDRITAWRERLRGWAINVMQLGLEAFMHVVGKAGAKVLRPWIEAMEATGEVPEELKPIFEELKNPTTQWQGMVAMMAGGNLMGGAIGTLGDVMFGSMARAMMKKVTNRIMEMGPLIHLWRRGDISKADFYGWMAELGFDETWVDYWLKATEFLPSAPDLVNWQAKEVFEPRMIERYGLDDEFEEVKTDLFAKIGVTEEQARNYWRAHWEHASWMQVVEMLHRGELTEEEVWDWFRLVEIPPFWRQHLIDIAYTWPTRVDVRRWWDMRTIKEDRLRELYAGMGYHGKNLDDYVLWTKVYVAFPDLMARWSKGWITLDEVRAELTGLGMPAERLEEMIQMKIEPAEPERTTKEKDLTKTEIYKGVKKGLITWGEGIELLMDLGYSEDEADYILAVNVGVLEGSPETFEEFKDLTQKWRLAAGREVKPMPEELKQAGVEVVRLTKELEALKRSIAEEEAKLVKEEILPKAATKKRDELRVALHRAEAQLAENKSHYDSLLAQWRHGG